MKKAIFIAFSLLIVLSFVSCNAVQDENTIPTGAYLTSLTSMQYGSSGAVQGSHRNEVNMGTQRYKTADAPRTFSVEIAGITYDLEYSETENGPYYNDVIHKYTIETDEGTFDAEIDASTGKCISVDASYFKKVNVVQRTLTHEQQYEIAYQFMTEHVDHPEEFRNVFQNGENLWFVYFARYVGELETYERVEIIVDQTGKIMCYSLEHIGNLNGVESVPESIIEMAHAELERRGNGIYGVLEEGYTYTLETIIDCLVRLDDGRLALRGHVDADITTPDGAKLSDGAWFIIPITEPAQ